MSLEVGKIYDGIVTGITNFGAFVELGDGKTGLVHISEVADAYVKDVHNYLKEKEKVRVMVLSIDGNGRISLSIKRVKPARKVAQPEEFDIRSLGRRENYFSFDDKLEKFLKESAEIQADIKKSTDSKRGSGLKRERPAD